MLAYDLIGFQTEDDCNNFIAYVQRCAGAAGARRRGDLAPRPHAARRVSDRHRRRQVRRAMPRSRSPIRTCRGCGAASTARSSRSASTGSIIPRAWSTASARSTGCGPTRPQLQRAVSLLQIATPSRGTIEAYGKLQADVARLVTEVNGRHGEVDWTPIRYLNKGFSQQVLAGLYRTAQVGVVTPLHDGMNLVAKEYVAAQNPADPGVLVLSKFAGAANELDAALLVNPHDIDGMARSIATALSMPLTERQLRYEAMMQKLRQHTIQHWFAEFIDALGDCQLRAPRPSRCPPSPPSLWPLRTADSGITGVRHQSSRTVIPGEGAPDHQ